MKTIYVFAFSVLFVFACTHKPAKETKNTTKLFAAIGISPKADTLKPTRITLLDTCPKPRIIAIPTKPTSYTLQTKSGAKTIQLTAPETKPAGFYTPMTTYTAEQGLYSGIVCEYKDKSENLWFGTNGGGASRYDGKSFSTFTIAQGLANNSVYSIVQDKSGNLWFGTYGGGASRYDGKSFTTFTTAQGLANNTVLSIVQDKSGNLWFGTDGGGVSRYDGKSFSTYTTAQGLANNTVPSIVQDQSGNLWFGTNEGFSELKGYSLSKSLQKRDQKSEMAVVPLAADNTLSNTTIAENYTPVFEKYNFRNGYPVKDVNTNAMFVDSKGIIWAGTGDKLVRFDYSGIHKNLEPPTVILQDIKLQSEKICWYDLQNGELKVENGELKKEDSLAIVNEEINTTGSVLNEAQRDTMRQKFAGVHFDSITRFYPLPEHLVLPYKHNNITFDFAAVEPAKPYLVRYQYMLEGYDKDWNPVTDKTTATFGNIYEGTYTFKLKAQSPEGVWSEPVTYTFKVLPPLERTWWAYSIYIILIGGSLYFFFRWRTAQLRKDKEHLEQVVVERTAEVVQQKAIVEEKNKDITDSILYASRIQRALLTTDVYISRSLNEHFILFKPRDIVSGDFYWNFSANGLVHIACCDCTGHGVPGAFMSLLNISLLNETVIERKIIRPDLVLNDVRKNIIKALNSDDTVTESKDGMDAVFCTFDFKNKKLQAACANNPIWIISAQGELTEIKPDKMPVGVHSKEQKLFTLQEINLTKGDCVYLFTDGYADQFGGSNGKKFKYKQLKELLIANASKPMDEQKLIFENAFETWKDKLDQVDDVLVMGVRI
ncbi:MAG: two-component regulator propeller domain-containing protein [Bacteroidia bacterium]